MKDPNIFHLESAFRFSARVSALIIRLFSMQVEEATSTRNPCLPDAVEGFGENFVTSEARLS
jgi:hypothetical protein